MDFKSKLLNDAVEQMSSLPGIGQRSALRLVLHLLDQSEKEVNDFTKAFINLKEHLNFCDKCYHITEQKICEICRNPSRSDELICVVQDVRDLLAIESTQQFYGKYHVLGGVISPMEGVGPNDIKVNELKERIINEKTTEIILALPAQSIIRHPQGSIQFFLNAPQTHCFFDPLRNYCLLRLTTVKTDSSRKVWNARLKAIERFECEFSTGLPENKVQEVSDKLQFNFDFETPFSQYGKATYSQVKCTGKKSPIGKAEKTFKFRITRLDHVELISDKDANSLNNAIEMSREDLTEMMYMENLRSRRHPPRGECWTLDIFGNPRHPPGGGVAISC